MRHTKFKHLLSLIEKKLIHEHTHRIPITPGERLAVMLRYLASGDSQQSIAMSFRMGKMTVSCIVKETCQAIWEDLQPQYLRTPSYDEWKSIAQGLWKQWNFTNCLGAIDGKHVIIQAPKNSGSSFVNYKGTHSLVLMGVCDSEYCFTYVDIGASGRQSDGGIFASSSFAEALVSGTLNIPEPAMLSGTSSVQPQVFVGDEAFPLKENILRPYPGRNLDPQKAVFNYRLSRARRIIENTFGILASSWRIYRRPIIANVKTVELIIQATCCLHNYLMKSKAGVRHYNAHGLADTVSNGQDVPGTWRSITENDGRLADIRQLGSNYHSFRASAVREEFATYFQSPSGAVPWQYDRAYI